MARKTVLLEFDVIFFFLMISSVHAAGLEITITTPADGQTYYSTPEPLGAFYLQASASEAVDAWWYSLDGGENRTFVPYTTFIDKIPLGTHTINVYANDTYGNVGMNKSTFTVGYSFTDMDGDKEEWPNDCDDFDYYTFTGAVNIPYDIIPNDCYWSWDSTIKDINDPAPPSSNSTYYIGENVTIVSTRMNKPFFIAILDSENRTYNYGPNPNKITDLEPRDVVWLGTLTPGGGILGEVNKTILLPDLEKHPPGIYTIYLWFVAYGGGDAGTQEYIPIETFTVVERPTPAFNISLHAGWNLVSVPLETANTSVEHVLAPIEGKYTAVFAWDAANGAWLNYAPGSARNTLQNLGHKAGFWIYMTEESTLELQGAVPSDKSVLLKASSWNLVGYPSDSSMTPEDAFQTISGKFSRVSAYNSTGWSAYVPGAPAHDFGIGMMRQGLGYWIYINATEDVLFSFS